MKLSDWLQIAINILGGLGVFLYGMRVMSRGLESLGGDSMRKWLQRFTNSPFLAVLTGLLVTSLIQSSSATTVMLVSLVHAGFLNLTQAIGVILGANIGTTLTGWLVALLGFKVKIAKFALPIIGLGVLLIFISKGGRRRAIWGEILVGFGLLFLGLMFMKNSVAHLHQSPYIMSLLSRYSANSGFLSLVLIVGIGTLVTIIIQSSSATMALTITLAYQGLLDFPTAAALILGENIGTTITANLASIGTDVAARRTARAHFFFNIFGVIWALIFFMPFLWLVDYIVPGDPFAKDLLVRRGAIANHMAAFHTLFNITNTLIFLPLIPFLAKFITKIVKGDALPQEERHILYLDTHVIATPVLAMVGARKEIQRMYQNCVQMFDTTMNIFEQHQENAKDLVHSVQNKEELLDNLEKEITSYLSEVSRNQLSARMSQQIAASIHITHNIEKMGDYTESILRLLRRRYEKKLSFNEEATENIQTIARKVREFLELIAQNIDKENPPNIMEKATQLEDAIDELRTSLRKSHIKRLTQNPEEVPIGLIFIDLLTNFEKIGDHAFNIAQYLSEERI